MTATRAARWIVNGAMLLFAAAALAIVAGGLLKRPVLLGMVPSGSMAPQLERGDLALIVPAPLLPPVGQGDVVVFAARDTPWVVHRIVGGDAETGFVTKGDANPNPDVARVRPEDVAGVVPRWGDGLARLPAFGQLVPALAFFRKPVVIAVLLAATVLAMVTRRPTSVRRVAVWRDAPPVHVRHLTVYFSLASGVWLVVALQSVITTSAVDGRFTVVEASKDGLIRGEVLAGTTRTETLTLSNPFPLPVAGVFAVQSPGVAAHPDRLIVPPGGVVEAQLSISGERPLGEYPLTIRRSFFLPVLPLSWLAALAAQSSMLAAAAVALVPAAAVAAVASLDPRAHLALRWLSLRLWLRLVPV